VAGAPAALTGVCVGLGVIRLAARTRSPRSSGSTSRKRASSSKLRITGVEHH